MTPATLYEGGMSLREIAATTGANLSTLHKSLIRAGVQMRGPGRRLDADKAKRALSLFDRGLTYQKIARALGCKSSSSGFKWVAAGRRLRDGEARG